MVTRTGTSMADLGPYARHLRPFLNVNHENGSTPEQTADGSVAGGLPYNTFFQGDEYTRTRLAVTTPKESTQVSVDTRGGDAVDTYSLTLCDASVAESTTPDSPDESTSESQADSFTSVGMISEWLTSITKKPVGNADVLSIQADNALLQLIADSPSSEEALEIIEDAAQEGRPWDLDGSAYTALTGQAVYLTNTNQSSTQIVHVPCGLLELTQQNFHNASDILYTEFEILDIYDM